MKDKLPKLQFTKDGHIIMPAMLVDCSRRGIQQAAGKPAGFQDGQEPPASGGATPPPNGNAGETGTDPDPNIVSVQFRLITAMEVIPGIWFAPDQVVDFRHADGQALKEARDIISNSPRPVGVLLNHSWWDVRSRVGRLGAAVWEQSTDIPPGVNSPVRVNRQFDARTAIGLETGELDAGSIAIDNTFSLSHPDMDIEEFIARQGEIVDGQKVRWLAEHTTAIDHFALTLSGADPYAGPREAQFDGKRSWSGYQFEDPNKHEGGRDMKGLLALLQMVCAGLGISVALTENGPLPEKLDERVKAELDGILNAAKKYNGLAAEVEKLGPDLLREGEVKLTAEQVLERLPQELAFVSQGKAYLEDIRTQVLKAFDVLHVKPDKQALSEVELRERKRIEASADLEYLKDQLALLNPQAQARFGKDFKVSQGEDPNAGDAGTHMNTDAKLRDAALRTYYAGRKPAGKAE